MSMKNMIEVLDKGWTVSNVVNVFARGQNDEGRGYLVTLAELENHLSREMYLPHSPEAETFLVYASNS
jgi:hypothetical protein